MAKKEKISDYPTDKAIRKLFPKQVVEKAKKEARAKDGEQKPEQKKS
jgi:hypothetical protein